MSFRQDILANYASQIYVTVVGVVMVPLFVRYMGAESYGLVGFFSMLQIWFVLLDMGLTATMTRETARFRGGARDAMSLRQLLRTLEGIFVGVAILGGAVVIAGSGVISRDWLNVHQLPLEEVQRAVMLMGLIIALRWTSGLYRGAISGFECLVWLSGFNIAIATARFVLVVPFFIYVGASPTQFFSYQLAVAILEVAVLVAKTYRLLPEMHSVQRVRWQWKPLNGVIKFSLSIAFTGSASVVATQTDKLILSKMLPLADYGYFILAVLVANGLSVISGPINAALLPRLNRLASQEKDDEFYTLYRRSTQLIAVIILPAAAVLALFAEKILWIWTGDTEISRSAAPVLALYAIGNAISTISAFPIHLQVAKGKLRLHVIGSALFLVILIPILILATSLYGAVGAGYSWLFMNVMYLLVWVPLVHRQFKRDLHADWLKIDLGGILLFSIFGAMMVRLGLTWSEDRSFAGMQLAIICAAIFVFATVGSPMVRATIKTHWAREPRKATCQCHK